MNKFLSVTLSVVLTCLFAACVPTRDYTYLYDVTQRQLAELSVENKFDLRIKPADDLLVKVTDEDGNLVEVFSRATVTMGTSADNHVFRQAGISVGFVVDGEGNVKLPLVGKVHVSGLTQEEAARKIESMIKEAKILPSPHITVGILSGRVTILGDISKPGLYSLESVRTTIFDIVAMASGHEEGAKIRRVQLFRENNGERIMYEMDLTDSHVVSSPGYYVQQNDMIYVYPSKKHRLKSSPFYTGLSAFSAILGVTATALGMYFLFRK